MIRQETRVRDLAYRLWEFSGKPAGRDLEFWFGAEAWVNQDDYNKKVQRSSDWTQDFDIPASAIASPVMILGNAALLCLDHDPASFVASFQRGEDYADITQRQLVKMFAPAAVLVNRVGELRSISGAMELYLDDVVGFSANAVAMVCDGLKGRLQRLIHQAARNHAGVMTSIARIKRDGLMVQVRLSLFPITERKYGESLFLVCFADEAVDLVVEEQAMDDSNVVRVFSQEQAAS